MKRPGRESAGAIGRSEGVQKENRKGAYVCRRSTSVDLLPPFSDLNYASKVELSTAYSNHPPDPEPHSNRHVGCCLDIIVNAGVSIVFAKRQRDGPVLATRTIGLGVSFTESSPQIVCTTPDTPLQDQRDDIIQRFRTGDIWVLICTDLMARGIDFKVK